MVAFRRRDVYRGFDAMASRRCRSRSPVAIELKTVVLRRALPSMLAETTQIDAQMMRQNADEEGDVLKVVRRGSRGAIGSWGRGSGDHLDPHKHRHPHPQLACGVPLDTD